MKLQNLNSINMLDYYIDEQSKQKIQHLFKSVCPKKIMLYSALIVDRSKNRKGEDTKEISLRIINAYIKKQGGINVIVPSIPCRKDIKTDTLSVTEGNDSYYNLLRNVTKHWYPKLNIRCKSVTISEQERIAGVQELAKIEDKDSWLLSDMPEFVFRPRTTLPKGSINLDKPPVQVSRTTPPISTNSSTSPSPVSTPSSQTAKRKDLESEPAGPVWKITRTTAPSCPASTEMQPMQVTPGNRSLSTNQYQSASQDRDALMLTQTTIFAHNLIEYQSVIRDRERALAQKEAELQRQSQTLNQLLQQLTQQQETLAQTLANQTTKEQELSRKEAELEQVNQQLILNLSEVVKIQADQKEKEQKLSQKEAELKQENQRLIQLLKEVVKTQADQKAKEQELSQKEALLEQRQKAIEEKKSPHSPRMFKAPVLDAEDEESAHKLIEFTSVSP
ncbi:hypothetical protein ACFORL_06790 [Legionella dresdenensis]|uniref:Uncharacterized protein n=1 Tax=Legionella dresdenensis TaxID=450200 RepID=A0ABV8CEL5_9GAMM